jgi:hypothetical protein
VDRLRFFFDELVTDGDMNLAFDQVEEADWRLASDLGVFGILGGAVPVPHQPVPDLSIDLTGPARAYDRLGRRVFVGAALTVGLEYDSDGTPTAVSAVGLERWLSVSLRFTRAEYDPRTDGNSQVIQFRQDETAEYIVRIGPEAPAGTAQRLPLESDELLVCDVIRRQGQTEVVATDIDTGRRQTFVMSAAEAIAAQPGLWQTVHPTAPTVQSALDAVDGVLTEHVAGVAHRHRAEHIDVAPPAFLTRPNVQELVTELVDALGSNAGTPGAARVGAIGVPTSPIALPPGTVDTQLHQLVGHHNAHLTEPTAAHDAAAIRATPHAHIVASSVQGQLEEIVADLSTTAAGEAGARRVGVEPISGVPLPIPAGPVQGALGLLLAGLNAHMTQPSEAHTASAIRFADTGNRYAAVDVEAALGEVMNAFNQDHVRPEGSSFGGWHRAIRQPQMTVGQDALLWESRSTGLNAVFRVYGTAAGVMFTINAQRGTNQWSADSPALESVAIALEQGTFRVMSYVGTTPFTAWNKTWRLVLGGASSAPWEVTGNIFDAGRVSCEGTNTATTSRNVSMGNSVNLRSRFLAAPSSITLTTIGGSNFAGDPLIDNIDRDGFTVRSTQFVAAGVHSRWVGRYTAFA